MLENNRNLLYSSRFTLWGNVIINLDLIANGGKNTWKIIIDKSFYNI
jgi:hypothetical protein